MDGEGNETTLSTHNRTLLPDPPASVPQPWNLHTKNACLGVEQNVDMAAAIKDLEGVTGKKYIYSQAIPKEAIRYWYADQTMNKAKIEEQRIQKELQKDIEIGKDDA